MRHVLRRVAPLLLVTLAAPAVVTSEALYRWVDDEGQLHLSDHPPPAADEQAERLPLPAYASPEQPPDAAPYSILNQLRRLEASREPLARERLEAQRQQQEYQWRRRQLEALENPPQPPAGVTVLAYPRPAHRPVHRPYPPPHGLPHPQHPPTTRSLWQPDHPAYRPTGPARPMPRLPYGTDDMPRVR